MFFKKKQKWAFIEAKELERELSSSTIQLIDVRSEEEFSSFNIGGISIPLKDLISRKNLIDTSSKVVFCCENGESSLQAVRALLTHDLQDFFILKGGLNEFKENVNISSEQ